METHGEDSEPVTTRKEADPSTGTVFNIQRFSVQDGPGIRTTVFLKGCPLRCSWCANPESQNTNVEVGHLDSLCDHCGRCIEVCEEKAITLQEVGIRIDRDRCSDCQKCVPVCAAGALRVFGEELSTSEIWSEIQKDVLYYRNSRGGITASGGEALNQRKLVAELFKRAQAAGLHTTLDTSGFGATSSLEVILEHTDLVLFDIKIMDPDAHLEHVGVPNAPIHRNARKVVETGIPMVIRVPLIPHITDTEENIRAIARFVRELGPDIPVNVLPYHKFGTNKYPMLDMEYELGSLETVCEDKIEKVVALFEAHGLKCEVIR
jgi:pyruvate formate lyase activating enzyme